MHVKIQLNLDMGTYFYFKMKTDDDLRVKTNILPDELRAKVFSSH